ncbi:MAG: hypothetical protein JWO71_2482 [Candidatus Acidoferrum typicum]|nr:hypothetical protein [Candidatus Acidoferrum typicum]
MTEQEVVTQTTVDIVEVTAPKKKAGRPKKLAPKGTPERREYQKKATQGTRARAAEAEDQAAQQIGSDKSPKDDEAKKILRAEGIKNPHVQDVLIENAKIAAVHYQIPYNRYLLKNGLRKTLAELKGEAFEAPVISEGELVDGEILFKKDLHYLWDFGYFRQPVTFEQWLEIRFKAKSSAFYLGREILGMDFHELHQAWTEFFPQFDPRGLKPLFSMEDAKAWLARQSEKKTFVLQCSRNSYKSSFAAILALTIILCQPSIRIRLVSATDDLASDFVAAIRRYFVIQIPDSPSLFVQLFSEYCIPPDEGQESMYECPLAHLNLVAATCEASSISSKQAGRRADVLLCDDVQEEGSVATDNLREKGITRFDLLQKLIEVGGYTISLSTPWHKKDISGVLIERSENDPSTLTAVRIDPAWEVLPHAHNTPILELKEADVKLVFPERLTFQFLVSEARKNIKQFLSQNLCIFPDDADSSKLKVHFDLDVLHGAVRSYAFFDQRNPALQLVGTYTGLDSAWSTERYADFSALITCKIFKEIKSGRFIIGVTDIRLFQLRIQELAQEVIRCFRDNRPDRVVAERSGSWQSLAQAINIEARERQLFPAPNIYWKHVSSGAGDKKSKAARIKSLEAPLATGQLVFMQHPMLEELFTQFVNYTGARSTQQKKDDGPDALAAAAEQYFFPLFSRVEKTEEEIQIENDIAKRNTMWGEYDMYFGTAPNTIPHSLPSAPQPAPTNPLTSHLSRFGMVRPRA